MLHLFNLFISHFINAHEGKKSHVPMSVVPCFSFPVFRSHPGRIHGGWCGRRCAPGRGKLQRSSKNPTWNEDEPNLGNTIGFLFFSCLKEHPDPLASFFLVSEGFPLVLMETMLSCRLSIIAKTMILNGREWFDTFSWVPRSNVGSTKPFFCVDSYRCYRCG